MPAFEYIAITAEGKQKKGVMEADTERQVRQKLRENALTPTEVNIVASGSKKSFRFSFGQSKYKLDVDERVLITRQLATLISASTPIEEALATVAEQTEKPRTKTLMLAIRSKVLEGYSLAKALGSYSEAFPHLFQASIEAGEKSGHLATVLEELANYTEQQHATQQKIKQALIYPSLMTLVSIGIVAFLLTYVVPRIVTLFSDNEQSLPAITELLLTISDFITAAGVYIVILIIALVFLWRRLLKKYAFRFKVHSAILKLPLMGRSVRLVNSARFFRTLGMLAAAGVPVLEAMRVANQLINNLPIREAVDMAAGQIREGVSIHKALMETNVFPPLSLYLIASGERSGELDNMLIRAADYHDREVKTQIDTFLSLFEPMMILTMGAIVLFIVLAILLPIFSLDQLTVL